MFLRDGETYEWGLEKISGDNVGEVEIGDQSESEARPTYHLNGEAGTAEYYATYTAVDGLYSGDCTFTLTVIEGAPDGMPTELDIEARYEIATGETLKFDVNDIEPVGGSLAGDAPIWRDYWTGDWDWENDVSEDWEDDVRWLTFHAPGFYRMTAALGIGNCVLTKDIEIRVLDAGKDHVEVDLKDGLWYHTFYLDGNRDGYFGDIYIDNLDVREEDDYEWVLERVEGGEGVVDLELGESGWWGSAPMNFRLGGEPGTVVYQLRYSALGGFCQGSTEIRLTVEENKPEDLPTGIRLGGDDQTVFNIGIGEPITFLLDDIQPNVEIPGDLSPWRDYWPGNWDWSQVKDENSKDERMYIFNEAGRYILTAAFGIGNCVLTKEIDIRVRGEGEELNPDLRFDARFATAYLDGERSQNLGSVLAENLQLLGGDEHEWSIEPVEPNENVGWLNLDRNNEGADNIPISYTLAENGAAGTITYRVTYTAANGLYSGNCKVTLTVSEESPTDLPTALVGEESFAFHVGDTLHLDAAQIESADGTLPGENVWREYWLADGDWGANEERWDNGVRHVTFRRAGEYKVIAVLGIGNHLVKKEITIDVEE